MYMYIYMYIHICICIHVYTRKSAYTCVHIHVCRVCVYVSVYTNTCAGMRFICSCV